MKTIESQFLLRDKLVNILEKTDYNSVKIPGDGLLKELVESDLPKLLYSAIPAENNFDFSIEGSIGKGSWAIIPWVAIMNRKITNSVSEGHYIVYLFSMEFGKVYLTLNQGTGGIDKARSGENQLLTKDKILKEFGEKTLKFNKGEIPKLSLDSKGRNRPRAYEKACILWKSYDLEELKDLNDQNLKSDLSYLIDIYGATVDFDKTKFSMIHVLKNEQINFDIKNFQDACKNAGLVYSDKLITRFVSSLLTKPFVLLTGLSGSGKTKLAQAFVQWICQDENQYRIIPVGADWTNREPLLGYPNALKPEEYVKPDSGVIDLILAANSNPELPHFLILDEMNLSHVERYFADFLSVMESNEVIPLFAEGTTENGVPSKLKVPSNLFFIGTVNIDETTNMFSPKVLDRANTIEFRINNEEMKSFLSSSTELNMDLLLGKGANMSQNFISLLSNKLFTTKDLDKINETLLNFFGELQKTGAEFGYRSATEILRLINQLSDLNNEFTTHEMVDIAIMQKLLPKLHGSRRKLSPVLETLGSFCVRDSKIVLDKFRKEDFDFTSEDILYPLSLEKIARMYKGAIDNGFASYAEA